MKENIHWTTRLVMEGVGEMESLYKAIVRDAGVPFMYKEIKNTESTERGEDLWRRELRNSGR